MQIIWIHVDDYPPGLAVCKGRGPLKQRSLTFAHFTTVLLGTCLSVWPMSVSQIDQFAYSCMIKITMQATHIWILAVDHLPIAAICIPIYPFIAIQVNIQLNGVIAKFQLQNFHISQNDISTDRTSRMVVQNPEKYHLFFKKAQLCSALAINEIRVKVIASHSCGESNS